MRSAGIGEFIFTPPGANERFLKNLGFEEIRVEDVTANSARVAEAWFAAREKRAKQLDEVEGAEQNASTQKFLATAKTLVSERRLSRFAYTARRP